MKYLDGDTLAQCHQFLQDGGTLAELAGKLHIDTEYLGRLLQLPTAKPTTSDATEFNLWAVDRLQAQL